MPAPGDVPKAQASDIPATPLQAPEIHMPEAEAEALRAAYRAARVIGEYGAGGSTAFAALECSARVLCVESDMAWIRRLRDWLDAQGLDQGADRDRIRLHHCDLGPTGAWGYPSHLKNWPDFWHYPYALWQDPGFDPDLVLIDGRFRVGCLAACMIHCRKPLTVLFDDYADRKVYHHVEQILPRAGMIGRMARFEIAPGGVGPAEFAQMVPWFFSSK